MPSAEPALPSSEIDRAVAILRAGGLVAMPTETVYGLAGDATNPEAVRRIFAVKGRPADHPVIVHVPDAGQLDRWAVDVPEGARRLAARFWPGPLTLVLRKAPGVPARLTGGQDTIGLRIPGHPVALELLRRFGGALAAPSANRFGRVSPTSAAHVRADLGTDVDCVLDGGECDVGVESTIVDLTGPEPRLLRPGGLPLAALEVALGAPLGRGGAGVPRASGGLPSHYAPRVPLLLADAGEIRERGRHLAQSGLVPALLVRVADAGELAHLRLPETAAGYAHGLYAALRELDAGGRGVILVERVPEGDEWLAVRDRLERAAHGARLPGQDQQ